VLSLSFGFAAALSIFSCSRASNLPDVVGDDAEAFGDMMSLLPCDFASFSCIRASNLSDADREEPLDPTLVDDSFGDDLASLSCTRASTSTLSDTDCKDTLSLCKLLSVVV